MFGYLRRRAVSEGFLGDSRLWLVIGVVTWSVHLLRRFAGKEPRVVYKTELEPGQSLVISDLAPIEAKGPGKSVRLET